MALGAEEDVGEARSSHWPARARALSLVCTLARGKGGGKGEEMWEGETMPSRSRFDIPHSHSSETECKDSIKGSLGPGPHPQHAKSLECIQSIPHACSCLFPPLLLCRASYRSRHSSLSHCMHACALARRWPGMGWATLRGETPCACPGAGSSTVNAGCSSQTITRSPVCRRCSLLHVRLCR